MKKRQIFITSLGNTLEWFDFGLFIFFAPLIGQKFFPTESSTMMTLAALSVFSAGFICRPLGGILFGHAGDTLGRAKTLRLSILIITISTLLIGLLPTYQSIGILAPIIFIMLRLVQGISVGGEYGGVMIYLYESAPIKKRGFITSFAAIGANLGFLFATLVLMLLNKMLSEQAIFDWGWRLPFILVGLYGATITYYRFKLTETSTFSYLKNTHHIEKSPFITALRYAPKQLLKIFCLTCMSSSLYYIFFGYMPIYLHQYLGINVNTSFTIQSCLLIIMLVLVPLAGMCGDYWGRKSMLMITALSVTIFALPCFYLLQQQTITAILISLSIATLLSSFDQGNSLSAVVENCPANIRYSGISFSYNLGMALFGGLAPLIVTLLIEKVSLIAPAFYLIIMSGISLIAASTLLSKTNAHSLIIRNNEVTAAN